MLKIFFITNYFYCFKYIFYFSLQQYIFKKFVDNYSPRVKKNLRQKYCDENDANEDEQSAKKYVPKFRIAFYKCSVMLN